MNGPHQIYIVFQYFSIIISNSHWSLSYSFFELTGRRSCTIFIQVGCTCTVDGGPQFARLGPQARR